MENLLLLVPTHHPMIIFLHKPWIRLTLNLLTVALLMGATSCKQTRDETWYCYDRNSKPVEGVIVICHYNLANSGKSATTYRLSDATGKIFFDFDEDPPDGLIRGYSCIYSPRLRSGAGDLGERWHDGQPIPNDPVYFDEWNNKIYIKSGTGEPLIWHDALNALISAYFTNMHDNNDGAKLKRELGPSVSHERSLFLEEYGERLVPLAYLDTAAIRAYYPFVAERKNTGLRFKDITRVRMLVILSLILHSSMLDMYFPIPL